MEHCYPLLICVAWLKSTSAQINFQHLKNDKVNKIQLTQKWITEVKTSTCIERYSKKKKKKTKASQQKEKINNKSKEPTKQRIINTVFQNRFQTNSVTGYTSLTFSSLPTSLISSSNTLLLPSALKQPLCGSIFLACKFIFYIF